MLPEATAAVQRRGGAVSDGSCRRLRRGSPGFCSGAASCSQSWPDAIRQDIPSGRVIRIVQLPVSSDE